VVFKNKYINMDNVKMIRYVPFNGSNMRIYWINHSSMNDTYDEIFCTEEEYNEFMKKLDK